MEEQKVLWPPTDAQPVRLPLGCSFRSVSMFVTSPQTPLRTPGVTWQRGELHMRGQRESCPISCSQEKRKKSHFTVQNGVFFLFTLTCICSEEEILKRFCCLSFPLFYSPLILCISFSLLKLLQPIFLWLKQTNIFNNINNTWISLSYKKVKISQVKVKSFWTTILNPDLVPRSPKVICLSYTFADFILCIFKNAYVTKFCRMYRYTFKKPRSISNPLAEKKFNWEKLRDRSHSCLQM